MDNWIYGALVFVCVCLSASAAWAEESTVPDRALRPTDLQLIRHREIQTGRPFAFDVDEHGVLWQGCADELWAHDTRTGKARRFAPVELKGKALSSVFCFKGKIVVVHQVCDHATVFDPSTGVASVVQLPGTKTNAWYGVVVSEKLLLFDRSDEGGVLILDSPTGPARKIPAIANRYPAGGKLMPDGRVIVRVEPDKVMQLFDPKSESWAEAIPIPYPDAGLSGSMIYDDIYYAADSAAGRLVAYSFREKRWLEPIPTPDYGKVYGFIGAGFQVGSRGYFCLSTYRSRSRIDIATGKLIVPPDAQIGVDGHPYRFLDRFLVFDARTRSFEYLTVPPQPDGIPLICYSLARGDEVYITGYIIPFGPGKSPSAGGGDWLVWQRH